MRKDPIVTGEIYHVYNRSIAGYIIFNNEKEFLRIKDTIGYYKVEKPLIKFSESKDRNFAHEEEKCGVGRLVDIICYCPMPTHIHLVLKQLIDGGISKFINNVLNSYSHYFNIKHNRKGPLWEGRFRNVLVDTDEQLLHLTRYIHLNPVTGFLVDKPEDWKFSSYGEYIGLVEKDKRICEFDQYIDMSIASYAQFVNSRIDDQRELAKIKKLILDEPTPLCRRP